MTSSQDPALSFGAAAHSYQRARPGYPDEIVDWLLEGIDGPVIDVGAGTGKLTASLLARHAEVVAVEPDQAMRAMLLEFLPHADVREGAAESIPAVSESAGMITFAQAWHWVDVPRACAEAARVLRRPGRLGLVWNYRWEDDEWVARLSRALGGIDSAGQVAEIQQSGPTLAAPFGRPERRLHRWDHLIDVETLVALAASRSYVITKSPQQRDRVLADVRRLGEERADADGSVSLPYRTFAFRASLS